MIKMTDRPLVSILMTSFNREEYIAEAIESVLRSTYPDFELIIVDDVSKDDTVKIAQSYAAKDERVKVYVNEKNLGDYPNRNKAASYAKGKYIKYLDSDDMIYDFGLEYCVAEMERNAGAGIGMIVYEMGKEGSECWSPEKIVHEHFFSRQYLSIGPSGSIFRRDKFVEVGGFDTRFGVTSDMYFNIKVAASSPVVLLKKPFFYYREHNGQEKNNEKGYIKFGYLYFKDLMEKVTLPLQKAEIDYLYKKMKKRHAVTLTRYLLRTRDLGTVRQLMKDTDFGFIDIVAGFFK